MSERQARIKRKNEPQQEVKRKKGSIWGNVIIVVVIIAFLGLGLYAIKDKLPKPPVKPVTVETLAKEKKMSVEDFLKEYGLDASQVNKDTEKTVFESMLTVENYAKYSGKTVEALLSENGIKSDIDTTITWQEAQQYETIGHLVKRTNEETGENKTLEEFLTEREFPEDLMAVITEDTTLQEAEAMWEDYANALAAEQNGEALPEDGAEEMIEDGAEETVEDGAEEAAETGTDGE